MVFSTKCRDLVLAVVLRLRRGEEGRLGRFKAISSLSRKFLEAFKFLINYIRVLLESGGKGG